jgi:general secretion pathway protein E/type IV pilus assembly protein PilB
VAVKDDYLLDKLLEMGLVSEADLDQARFEAESAGDGVLDHLQSSGVIHDDEILLAKAAHFGVEVVSIRDLQLSDEVIQSVRRDIARKYGAVPVFKTEDSITIALADPSDLDTIDSLQHLLGVPVELRVAAEDDISDALEKYYGGAEQNRDDTVSKMIQDITEGNVDIGDMPQGALEDDTDGLDSDAPIIKLVNTIIVEAYKSRASDIHMEPLAREFRLRYRIDGVLHEVSGPPKKLQAPIISRLKIMAGMSISEKRVPQDGRIQVNVDGKSIDLRVSCLPTNNGESIVMRILDKEGLKLGLDQLGFFPDDQMTFEKLISLPDGIILVTGPTGSGKTTTLYSSLHYINRPDRKIITVEDPVEYVMSGINQVQVNKTVGLTFAEALRSMLRQSPNVVMLGEIRDMETATIAINASLTGHLVFSTLHTNDAASATTRLIDIGVQPFLVASSARAFMAQRLVRRLCQHCKQPYQPTQSELRTLDLDKADLSEANFLHGRGCSKCSNGYRGRFGIYEVFVADDEIRKMIYDKTTASLLKAAAVRKGMRTLRGDGIRKVLAGLTTPEEVISATVSD